MYFKKIIIISVFSLLGGCGDKTADKGLTDIISIDPHKAEEYINLSEIVDSVKCIKLQTDSNDIMGRIREIVIKKKYIYAMDASQHIVFVFDKVGKFVSKLNKRGQGTDEYASMGPVFIDDNEEYIELIDRRGAKTVRLKYTNISFELVEISPFPADLSYNSCRRSDSTYYFATQQIDNIINGKKTNAGLVILDDKNKMTILFDKNIETNNHYFSANSESFTQNDKNELFVSIMYDNTFYRLEAGEAYPVFSVDFGEYGINNEVVGSESTERQMAYIKDMDGIASFPVLNINNSNILSFSYYFKQEAGRDMFRERDMRQYIKIKDKVYHVKKIKNDITSFPDRVYINSYFFMCNHEVWHEDYLVDIVIPSCYFPDDEERIFVDDIGEVTAYDDPIIVMMKLKESIHE
ncbi:MAG: 6-bladed beta-propeller [Bacteroidales bacterium]|jgi:hypothetical protein|nr:6-bladed beta-propeller [Bacteroidales bacterium]